MPDPQQRYNERVPSSLCHDAVTSIDEDNRQLASRGTGGHVARVLLVTRRIGNDELAAIGRKIAIRDVDRDPLLALGFQAVSQQGKVDLAGTSSTNLLAIAFHGGELVFVDHLGVVQQPTDQRAFTVVNATASKKAQQLFLLVAGEVGVNVFLTQINGLHIRSIPLAFSAPSTRFHRGRSPALVARNSLPPTSLR